MMTPEEIKSLRLKLQMSQQAFAVLLGMGIATISRWELGKCRPSRLAKMALYKLKEDKA